MRFQYPPPRNWRRQNTILLTCVSSSGHTCRPFYRGPNLPVGFVSDKWHCPGEQATRMRRANEIHNGGICVPNDASVTQTEKHITCGATKWTIKPMYTYVATTDLDLRFRPLVSKQAKQLLLSSCIHGLTRPLKPSTVIDGQLLVQNYRPTAPSQH